MRARYFQADCCVDSCSAAALEDAPFPICTTHYIEVVRHFQQTVKGNGYTADLYGQYDVPIEFTSEAEVKDVESVVYFVRFGDKVKIGVTTNLAKRLTNLPCDELLGTIPGDHTTERDMHQRFANHHHKGEWFRLDDEARRKIAEVITA